MKLKPIKVSNLNSYIKKYLLGNALLSSLRVEGEVSNIRVSKTGYTYFSLCDDKSCINCIAFFEDRISNNGDMVIVEGELNVYEEKGTYQIVVRNIERIGLGKILLDLEILKEKLKKEGMFEHHREIPTYPSKIGIVTSNQGAALRDILKTFETVKGNFEVIIYNALVQGEKSKNSITKGIRYLNNTSVDVILIARGGGSFEDLNVFNDISIAEEVFKSDIPVVTGIGHETDRTLVDFVADIYCHTPTAAAERIVRGYKDVEEKILNLLLLLNKNVSNNIMIKRADLKSTKYILKSYLPLEKIYKYKNLLEKNKNYIKNYAIRKLSEQEFDLQILREKLNNYNYNKQLTNGYAIVTDENNKLIKNFDQIEENNILNIRFHDFIVKAKIINKIEVNKHE